jgi:hypothetical protein
MNMVDYDVVMSGGWDHRVRLLDGITAEDKAEFVRTHRRRWLAANRYRLSPAQLSSMEEQITFISAELYRQPIDPDLHRQCKELEARAMQRFSPSDIYQLTLHGDRVPEVI